jgi:hypothetical protein
VSAENTLWAGFLSAHKIQLENCWAHFDEIGYGLNVIEDYPKNHTFLLPTINNINMAAEKGLI